MIDLQKLSDNYPPMVFFHQGTVEEGDWFFTQFWPEARAVSDPDRKFYDAFDIKRGGMREMFGANVWACGVRATLKGQRIGKPVGDPWVMPGLFLLSSAGETLWQHDFSHAGDHPNWETLPQQFNLLAV